MFTSARGEMFDWLQRNGRDISDCGLGSPVAHLARAGLLGENFLAIHVNCLAPGDAELLGRRRRARRPLPAQPRLFPPSAVSARAARRRRSQSLSRHRQPCDRPQNGKEKPELNLFEEMRRLAAARQDRHAGGNSPHGDRQRRESPRPGRARSANFRKMPSPT